MSTDDILDRIYGISYGPDMKTKKEVKFEHPAKGPHHCSECVHFIKPDSCKLVAGKISPKDWCIKFKANNDNR